MAEQIRVAISSEFLTAFARLPRQTQGKVTEFINKFRNDPTGPGIHYEKINGAADRKMCSVRIDDTYRGIVVRQPETGVYLLLWVDHHDAAYAWALRKRCEVNPRTGILQVYDVQTAERQEQAAPAALFDHVPDEALLTLGVPEAQLPLVRSLADPSAFYLAAGAIPEDAYENLTWLAEGFSVQEVLELAAEEQAARAPSEDLAAALEMPASMKSFVVVEGEEELRRIMAEPLEKWRVFLHPTQRKIVTRNYSGPARVLGGAGTGKTVVAMHRARQLAAGLPEGKRILFTTFTANLAADIQENLRKICTTAELRKIDIMHLDAWVSRFLRESEFTARIIYDEIDGLWEQAILEAGGDLPYEKAFYQEEWNRVVIAQEALTQEKYILASRNGRGTRLDRRKRIQVWKVLNTYYNLLREKHVRDINTAMYECRSLLLQAGGQRRYEHIIVDEGQDFGDNAYRLLRCLAGEEHANDIFIVGDAHQRIYKNHPVLSRCGIHVRGRSSILRINYRTTEEIRKYAFALLQGTGFDDLDDGQDPGDRCRSLMHGAAPAVRCFPDAGAEFDFLLQEIQSLQKNGAALRDICVTARTKRLLEQYMEAFRKAGIRTYEIKRSRTDDRGLDGLRVATMHRVKGLEFQYVFVAAVNHRTVPLPSAVDRTDAVSEAESLTAEKSLLYVALTRAQKGAYITGYGRRSEFLPAGSA